MKGRNVKKLDEIALLKTIITLCASFGAEKFTIRGAQRFPKRSYRIFIDLSETSLNIWTDDETILNALREMDVFNIKEET